MHIEEKYAIFIDGFQFHSKNGILNYDVNTNLFDYIIGIFYKIQEIDRAIFVKYISTIEERLDYYEKLCNIDDIFFLIEINNNQSTEYIESLLYSVIFFTIYRAIMANEIKDNSDKKTRYIKDFCKIIDIIKEKAIQIYPDNKEFIDEIDEIISDNKDFLN